VNLPDVNTPRIQIGKQPRKPFLSSSQRFHSIVAQSVIHYPIRGSWRPRQVTEVVQVLAVIQGRNEQR
jgi:hypothetical protein